VNSELRRIHNELLEEDLYLSRLPCGLSVFIMPRRGYSKYYAVFATHYGSIDSRFRVPGEDEVLTVPDGIAHFLEHKLFENKWGSAFDRFAELGASANAYTSYTLTAYLFSCTEEFTDNLDLLLSFVQDPYFTDENVAKEQGIIEQEIRMYEDHPDRCLIYNLLQSLYHENPVRKDIAGTVESIKQINKDLLYRCHNTFYHPANMSLFVTGDLEISRVMDQIAGFFARRDIESRGTIERFYPDEAEGIARERISQKLEVSRPRYLLGLKDRVAQSGRDLLEQQVTTRIMWTALLGRSSRLYNELYEAGLIDDGFSASHSASDQYAYSIVGGETEDPEQLHDTLLENLKTAKKKGIDEERFQRIKRKTIGSFLKAFNSLEFAANTFITYHFYDINFFDYLPTMEQITLADVNQRLDELVRDDNLAVSVILPGGDGSGPIDEGQ